jgi:release factor glutamine methyltransferase
VIEVGGTLARAGFIAAEEEAAELIAVAAGDQRRLESMLARRLTGEPLAWITGRACFCGLEIRVDPGVYVPRWQTEKLARRAVARLAPSGIAIDLCTGSGAIARTLLAARPGSRVLASEVDERAVICARSNGVEVFPGDLFEPLPVRLKGRVDVLVAVVPYVPTPDLPLLQRDTFAFESTLAYDGGPDGTAVLRRLLEASPDWLRPGGALLLELGGRQDNLLAGDLARHGYTDVRALADDEGDVRGIEATLSRSPQDPAAVTGG